MLSPLRFVKWHLLSFVFRFFVSSLFLLPFPSFQYSCVSITYEQSTGFQEEDYDDGIASDTVVKDTTDTVMTIKTLPADEWAD